ncbi:MAG: S41 family peptidase [Myxococcota bacterium]
MALLVVSLGYACGTSQGPQCEDPDFTVTDVATLCPGSSPSHVVFHTFWSALDQRYAVFDVRLPNHDWEQLGREACSHIHPDMGDDDLFALLMDLARVLDDGHVELISEQREADAQRSPYPHEEALEVLPESVERHYLDGPLQGSGNPITWGRADDLGYLSLTGMDTLTDGGDDEAVDVRAARNALREALVAFRGARGVVVDVRANEGGWDAVGLEIARWFEGPAVSPVWSKQLRNGPEQGDFGALQPVTLDASEPEAFAGPVVVLTSGATFSAGETFVLAMRQRPAVTVLGEPTSGHFSDIGTVCLPNGWALGLSSERYIAPDGTVVEGRGVGVDIAVPLNPEGLVQGRDAMLEAAFQHLRRP